MQRLEKIHGQNVWGIHSLKATENQKDFVSSNDRSIIEEYTTITGNGYRVSLVQAKVEDAPLVQAMQQEAFAMLLEKYQDYDISPATESLEKIQWKITGSGSYYYFIRVGEEIVGGIRIVDPKDGSRKRISPLYIMPDYRGKGYAQAAMLEAERIHGANHWHLDTILQEAGNCYLYEKMGYHQTGYYTVVKENMIIVDYEKD